MATITVIASIFKSNPAAKDALEKAKVDFDKGLKILEGSDNDGPTKLLYEEYKSIRENIFNWVYINI